MNSDQILKEVIFKAVRSSGAGGQHVNKVSTKVILVFDLESSDALTVNEKEQLRQSLATALTKENLLIIQAADTRSQLKNRRIAEERLIRILSDGLVKKPKRKKTKPTKAAKEKRLKSKRLISQKKKDRQKPDSD